MGMADMLIKLGITYGSEKSLTYLSDIYRTIAYSAIETSSKIAEENEAYPKCKSELILNSDFIREAIIPYPELMENIKKYGLANSQLLTCAPTGSIATMLQVSTGVEPNFALSYTRKTQSLHGEDTTYKVEAGIIEQYRKITGDTSEELPEYFIESGDILPNDRIKVQSVLQKYTDAAISSTINLKNKATKQDIYDIYINS
jgi:ribonucleoside-diphosphate reductase alpha chain